LKSKGSECDVDVKCLEKHDICDVDVKVKRPLLPMLVSNTLFDFFGS